MGGFYFRDPDRDDDAWHIVEDPELGEVKDGRQRGAIGVSSEPFGDARGEVIELATGDVVAEERTSEFDHLRGVGSAAGHRVPVPHLRR